MKILTPLPFLKYKTGWEVARDWAVTGWPYIKVHHPKNVYNIVIDCKLCNFNVYNMDEGITNEIDMHPSQIIQYLISKGYSVPLWFGIDHPLNSKTPNQLGYSKDKTLKP